MKVKLREAKALGFNRRMVSFGIKHGNFPMIFDNAIVDTGCPFLIISEDMAKTRRIPYKKYNKLDIDGGKPLNIGGILLELRCLGECDITLKTVDDQIVNLKHQAYVGVPLVPILQKLPSFLGDNFLRTHSLSICYEADGAYLRKL